MIFKTCRRTLNVITDKNCTVEPLLRGKPTPLRDSEKCPLIEVIITKKLYERFASWGQEKCNLNRGYNYKDYTSVLRVGTQDKCQLDGGVSFMTLTKVSQSRGFTVIYFHDEIKCMYIKGVIQSLAPDL